MYHWLVREAEHLWRRFMGKRRWRKMQKAATAKVQRQLVEVHARMGEAVEAADRGEIDLRDVWEEELSSERRDETLHPKPEPKE